MKQENNTTTTTAKKAKPAPKKTQVVTADRLAREEQAASKTHIVKIKRLLDAWESVRTSGAGECLLTDGSAWCKALQACGLSVIAAGKRMDKDADRAVKLIQGRYEANKKASDKSDMPIFVRVITQDGMADVPIKDAAEPLLNVADCNPEDVWAAYDSNVRSTPNEKCKLEDVKPFVSARDVLTVEQIRHRIPADRANAAEAIQRKVRSVLATLSADYAAFKAADLTGVAAKGKRVVHVVNVTYDDGASQRVK